MGEVLTNGVYLPDRGERNAYDGLKGNWNTLDSIAGKAPGYDGHISDTDIHVTAADKQSWNGKADASHVHNANDVTTGVFDAARIPNLDASKITTGTIDIDRLPQGALERLVKVADQAARYALTTDDVQLGDTVQQLDTGVMYVVTDETKLDSADGYTEYTAGSATSVPWSGVTGKPADYTPASHSHGNITNDGKVGTAANKPLITGTDGVIQAGSFGNQANTFCEGNDSRLSDARTPVAHTHTKSDVIGLFNSANSWTENNTYAKYILMKNTTVEVGNAPSNNTSKEISFIDKNNETLSRLVGKAETSGNSYIFLHATNKYTNEALDPNGNARHSYFYVGLDATGKAYNKHAANTFPDANNTYDLGSSSYQWNNLYAKNYFYNGVAWGLDKANVWTAWQTEEHSTEPLIRLRRPNLQIGDAIPQSTQVIGTIPFADKDNLNLGLIAVRDDTNGNTFLTLVARQRYDSNGRANNGTQYESRIDVGIDSSKNLYLRPNSNNKIDLGTSTNKWKTLNGINPGALSLPTGNDSESIAVDITDWYIQDPDYPDDPTKKILDATNHKVDTAVPGWLQINFPNVAGNWAYARKYAAGANMSLQRIADGIADSDFAIITLIFPIHSSCYVRIKAKTATVRIFPCLGNV